MGRNRPEPAEANEEWAEDDGFFSEFAKEASTGNSKEKQKQNRHFSLRGSVNDGAADDELTQKLRADEARKQIAAKVLARASPREVKEAIKKSKRGGVKVRKPAGVVQSTSSKKESRKLGKEKKRRR